MAVVTVENAEPLGSILPKEQKSSDNFVLKWIGATGTWYFSRTLIRDSFPLIIVILVENKNENKSVFQYAGLARKTIFLN